ncbi:MAG TPA: GLPGLI family protein [Arachidicoccus sp.]
MKLKTTYFLTAAILILPFCGLAQAVFSFGSEQSQTKLLNAVPIAGKVFYNFSNIPDTTRPDSLTQEVFELDFAKNASMFISYSSKLRDSAMKKAFEEAEKNAAIDANGQRQLHLTTPFSVADNQTFSRDQFYTDTKNSCKNTHIMNIITSVFLIEDTASKTDWHIEDSTKEIQGNLCQKAIGKSHGRTYSVWFCSDIAYSFGPRRLNGLPGLILEAHDEKHEVNYTFDHIETVTGSGEVIGLPETGIKTTPKEFTKVQEAFEKNPEAFFPSQPSQAQGKTIHIQVVKSIAPKGFKKPVNNNPIDLK